MDPFNSQKEMFDWIWENREHLSEISGAPLLEKPHPLWHWQFMHVLSKQAYPRYKLNPDNIMLGLPIEHETQEEFQIFLDRRQELKEQYFRGE